MPVFGTPGSVEYRLQFFSHNCYASAKWSGQDEVEQWNVQRRKLLTSSWCG
jgi:hypothetical protein